MFINSPYRKKNMNFDPEKVGFFFFFKSVLSKTFIEHDLAVGYFPVWDICPTC